MMDLHDRYNHDPKFKQLVDMMTHFILTAELTPSELRTAALLAAIRADNYNIHKFVEGDEDRHRLFHRLDILHDEANRLSKEQKL